MSVWIGEGGECGWIMVMVLSSIDLGSSISMSTSSCSLSTVLSINVGIEVTDTGEPVECGECAVDAEEKESGLRCG